MDVPSWKHDLAADRALIQELIVSMDKVGPEDDAKLQHLLSLIREKVSAPINPGNRKVLLFTAFADTADYLYENLVPFARPSTSISKWRPAPARPTATSRPSSR